MLVVDRATIAPRPRQVPVPPGIHQVEGVEDGVIPLSHFAEKIEAFSAGQGRGFITHYRRHFEAAHGKEPVVGSKKDDMRVVSTGSHGGSRSKAVPLHVLRHLYCKGK